MLMSWLSPPAAATVGKGEEGARPRRVGLNELSGSISFANGKRKTQDEMSGRANQLEMMESGNTPRIGLESPARGGREVRKKEKAASAPASQLPPRLDGVPLSL